ncbi:NCS1 family nucleobase:cation symporter-1 [Clostridium ljungdahlii]|uniref:Allantoin permease n=1 Tax=Clostridium ljungdahlii (strain ATCC 55383 / DSM 13528 / PETC) TaxID=748727 RepID=D8GTE7_CLOLD|nr:NCS1 family nucleobase:cation symporter-1 [Clostridium ljungdahlii]ADK14596.1 predicted nucleoside transporter family protein [Clostridium ljungdahlii DSM 13528]OAA85833.1 putative allantoin permease [Clostridium ljungdahlii DSM 13528]
MEKDIDVFDGELVNPNERLYNEDLAPAKERKWETYSIFAMWMSDVHSVGGYTFAAGLFFMGLTAWQVLLAEIIGISIVMFFSNLTSRLGTRLGVPYPVISRISFGVWGGNIPALIRGLVAVFWYGIQTYLASVSVVGIILIFAPGAKSLMLRSFLGLNSLYWIGFLIMWAVQLLIMIYGMEIVRKFNNLAGPLVYVLMFFLIIWVVNTSGGHINLNVGLAGKRLFGLNAVYTFVVAIALVVAYFSTIMLNVCDFTRFSPNFKVVKRANFLGLPVNFTLFSIASVITTAGSIVIFGSAIYDPILLVQKIPNNTAQLIGAVGFMIATLGINVIANLVSPVYDLANLFPKHINFKRGAIITAMLSIVVLPWKIYANPIAVNYFLGGLAAFLGPIFAIIIVDYYVVKKEKVDVQMLFQLSGSYWYDNGFNKKAVLALLLGVIISVPAAMVPAFKVIASFSWFIGVFVSGLSYWILMKDTVVTDLNDYKEEHSL